MTKYYKQGSNEPSSIPELTADNLTTADVNTPLSANQGVVIKAALDERVTNNTFDNESARVQLLIDDKAPTSLVEQKADLKDLEAKADLIVTDGLKAELDRIRVLALLGL